MHTDIIDKFTTHLKNVLTRALCLVIENKEETILPLHLFWALATQKGSIGAEILGKVKITEETVGSLFNNATARLPLDAGTTEKKPKSQTLKQVSPKLSPAAKRAIEKSVLTANLYEHKYVGTEHLLSGLLQIEDPAIKQFLTDHEVELKTLRQQVTLVLKSTSKFPELAASLGISPDHELHEMGEVPETSTKSKRKNKKDRSKTPALDFFSVDLTSADAQQSIDPVIGREQEIERAMQILCRRTKNNPVLLGDPGVGKTALVEGLAKRILANEVPEVLANKRILAVDLSLIVAGTMYRGEFEGRLKQIIDEVKANPEIILFIDEVHTIMGAGSASGSLDAANILKPALARGEIRCIGATTLSEYKKNIETDAALERRFQSVIIEEPSAEKTLKILEGVRKNYEEFHDVTITKDALIAAVELADRYLQDKFFPDKAIDLIDEASSSARVRQRTSARAKKLRVLAEELARIREEKRLAVMHEKFVEAISLKEQERTIEADIAKLERTTKKTRTGGAGRITARAIAEIVSRMTGVPTKELLDTERARLRKLESVLGSRILGQDEVISVVSEHIRRAKTGIAPPERPLASFLFVGPSGVGKTELAKIVAEEVFQDPDALVRLDMSEFSEGFTISKLIGAPAGYVGYRESAKLTDTIKRKPHAVVLFDELEKAHPDVLNLLLQILDDGQLTDATGRTVNFKNTILILTSNVGSERIGETAMGFAAGEAPNEVTKELLGALKERFRPEFLNRIDRVCAFRTLTAETLEHIIDLQLADLNNRLAPKKLSVALAGPVRSWLVEAGTNPEHGARALRRAMQDELEGQVASLLLKDAPEKLCEVEFVLQKGKPVLKNKGSRQ
jgi:ATP-dependent Clp protease ATP-binding subunit ClpC